MTTINTRKITRTSLLIGLFLCMSCRDQHLLKHITDGILYELGEEANPEHYASQMEAYREVIESAGLKCKAIVLFYATLGQIIELK